MTYHEYLQVHGLLTLAEKFYRQLQSVEAALKESVGDDDRVSDAIYGDENFDASSLLNRCGIEIPTPPDGEGREGA